MNPELHSYTKARSLEQVLSTERPLDVTHLKALLYLIIGLLCVLSAALPVRAQEIYATRAKQMDRSTYRFDLLEGNLDRLNKVIAVHLERASIQEAFEHVARRSLLRLSYGQEALSVEKRVTLKDEQVTVLEALHEIIRGTPLQLQLSPSGYVIVTKRERSSDVRKVTSPALQTGTIAGTVVDASTGEPLPGVNVVIVDTQQGSSTDAEGAYEITGVEEGVYDVRASFIGFTPQVVEDVEVVADETVEVDFALREGAIALDEIVAVGYGTQRREDVITGISTVSAAELGLMDQPTPSAADLLKGRVAGVNIRNNTGATGSTPVMRIRGITSINAGVGALIVIDGFPVGNSFPQTLNPDDIANITVLKDAAATAIYGARGSNGVVLVETTSARVGMSEFSYNAYFGIQQVPESWRPEMLNAVEYAQFNKERIEALDAFNNVSTPTPIPEVFLRALENPDKYGEGTDWLDEYFREGTEASLQNHNLTYTRGTETLRAVVSGGYLGQNGLIPGDDFQRLSLRTKFNATLHERVDMGVNLSGSRSLNNRVNTDGHRSALWAAVVASPLQSPYDEDGNLKKFMPGDAPGYFAMPNPLFESRARKNQLISKDLQINVDLDVEIAEGLRYTPRIYSRLLTRDTDAFRPSTIGRVSISGPGDLDRGAPPQNNSANYANFSLENRGIDNILRYAASAGDHSFNVLLGHSIQKEEALIRQIDGEIFPSDVIINFNQAGEVTASNDHQEWSSLAGFGRINYDYDSRYLAEVNFRREGSSRLGAANRYGNFPSGAVGWRISQEEFYPDNSPLNELLVRASFGKTGNNAIGNFDYMGRLGAIRTVLADEVLEGKFLTSMSNEQLRWETALQYQIGVTMSLFNNRAKVELDYYEKTTHDMLFNVSLPRASGFASSRVNIGEMENRGLEFVLNTFNDINGVLWVSNLNFSYMKNEVTKMPEQIDRILAGGRGGRNITVVGEEVGAFHGFDRIGIFDEETINNPNYYGWRGADPILGTNIFRDTNGDGFIDRDDMTVIGSPHPDVTLGFSNRLSYKGMSASILLTGMFGYQILPTLRDVDLNQVARWNVNKAVLGRWKSPDDPGDGFVPRSEVNPGSREWMDDWLEPGDHLWIKNVRLSYSLPNNIVGSLGGTKDVRLYVSIDNVARFDKYSGFNPEVGSGNPLTPGWDDYVYPVSRTYTIGTNIRF